MSKLNSFVVVIITLIPVVIGLLFSILSPQKVSETSTTDTSALFSEEARLWGKAHGPIQARIDFKDQSGDRVTLEGHIRSNLENFEITWMLPEGVRLVEGQLNETLQQTAEWTEHVKTIVVEVQWPLEKPHLVLRATENQTPDARGTSTVFNLDPSLQDMEKEEIIRAHMMSRKIKKIVK